MPFIIFTGSSTADIRINATYATIPNTIAVYGFFAVHNANPTNTATSAKITNHYKKPNSKFESLDSCA